MTGGAKIEEGQRKVPAKQCVTDVGRCWAAMVGMGGVQRRRSLCGKHGLIDGCAEHQRLRRHQPPRMDVVGRYFLQEALSYWSRSGHDNWPCLHHSRSWYVHS